MARIKNRSSLLNKYNLIYQKNPRSRVFAPLAETYRKLGMLDEAMELLKTGIREHPSYTLGYIVLANCYYDIEKFERAYDIVRPFISKNLENITLQKLFAKICLNLGRLEEALQTYKYLLLINPQDSETAKHVRVLEDDLLAQTETQVSQVEIRSDEHQETTSLDDWVQVSFNEENIETQESSGIEQNWNMNDSSPLEAFKSQIESDKIEVEEHSLEDQFFQEQYDNHSEDVIAGVSLDLISNEESKPIITHTLVDLYCSQGHKDKAVEVLESIIELHPHDEFSVKRLKELKLELGLGQIKHAPASQVAKIDKAIKVLNFFSDKIQEKHAHTREQS